MNDAIRAINLQAINLQTILRIMIPVALVLGGFVLGFFVERQGLRQIQAQALLGIGGVSLGLAFQSTLSNFLSGLLRIREYFDHLIIRHEFIKRFHKRFREENIEMPFPIKSTLLPIPGAHNGATSDLTPDLLSELPFLQDE